MKILFAGSDAISVPSLKALAVSHQVVGVLTAPDRARGRGRKMILSPVKQAALELDIPTIQPERLGAEAREMTEPLGADLLVVFAYGRIFGPRYLALFPQGGINMHPSALPEFRGPSPLTAAILAGRTETALTVQRVSLELDSGDILRQTPFPLDADETAGTLGIRVAQAAGEELTAVVNALENGSSVDRPQDHDAASYCSMISKNDGQIDWSDSAELIERTVRAYNPWPKAKTALRGEGLAILRCKVQHDMSDDSGFAPGTVLGVDKSEGILIKTGEGVLGVTELQLAARKALDHRAFLNGVPLDAGTQLGEIHES